MFIIDELEFERLEPICCYCGCALTIDEWEINGDYCANCAGDETIDKG